ncbi:MAG: tripartite tricarboxylate transporter substrate binding protein [Betaproteobacteria bacterium]|nr:tripartite tricarboxylate transporter substrate binding protein [Betaproteobacteria bacterium]
MKSIRIPLLACAWGAAAACAAVPAWAQDWKPTKAIEVIVGTPPGGPLDRTARLLQQLLEKRGVGVPVAVMNKPGGGHAIAMAYLNQHAGDGHHVSMALTNLITNRIVGSNPLTYSDVTPLALLTSEYIGVSVRVDSPVKDGMDLIARLRQNPEALTFAITNRASGNHIAAGRVLKAAGVELTRVKFVSFKGSAETTLAVLGGHVDVVMATPTSAWKHMEAGKMRMLAVSAPKRLTGKIAGVPTWKELGIDAVSPNWRALVGPKGMTAEQIAYWDRMLAVIVKMPEWQDAVRKNQWEDDYLNSADTVKFMQREYQHLEALLTDLGDAKK